MDCDMPIMDGYTASKLIKDKFIFVDNMTFSHRTDYFKRCDYYPVFILGYSCYEGED